MFNGLNSSKFNINKMEKMSAVIVEITTVANNMNPIYNASKADMYQVVISNLTTFTTTESNETTMTLSEIHRCMRPELRAAPAHVLADWERIVKLIWYTGAAFSTFGYALMILTAFVFKSWRRSVQNQLWMHVTTSNIAWIYLFISRDFSKCMSRITVICLLYVGHVTFFWMLACAWLTYRKLVTVFCGGQGKFHLKAISFTWLAPVPFCVLRGILEWIEYPDVMFDERAKIVTINMGIFEVTMEKLRDFLYVLGDFAMYFPPVACITVIFVIDVLVLYTLYKHRKTWGTRTRKSNIAIGLMFLVSSGVQFLYVMINRFHTFTKLDYFSAFLTTYNVFFNSMLFIFAIKETRLMWIAYLKKKIFRV